MAEPPVLPNQKRKFCYKSAQLSTSSNNKRRKDSNESKNDFEDDWDEELTLTQQELSELDNATSNAYTAKAEPSSSVKSDQEQAPKAATRVVAPGVLTGPHTQFLYPKRDAATYQPVPKLVQRSSSTSSSSSTFPVSSTTSYESSNSSHSSTSSSSLHKPRSDGSNSDITPDQKFIEELQHLRRESKKYNALKQNLYQKEGEIKILRTDLQGEKEKLSQFQQEKFQQEFREKNENEKLLKSEIEHLNVQLQFKEQEIVQLKDSLLNVKSTIASDTASPYSATTSGFHASSAKVRRVLVEKPSPQRKCPSDDSILSADSIGPKGNGNISISPQKSTSKCVCSTYNNKRKKILNVHLHHGKLTGSQLTSKLVQDTFNDTQSMSSCFNSGIIQLLQLHSTQDFAGLKFSRDSTSFLLKQKSKSMSDLRNIMNSSNKKDLVSSSNLNLAIHGLSQLLITDCSPTSQQVSSASHSTSPSQSSLNLLLQLVPLLADYLGHYCDQLSTNLVASSTDLCDSLTSGNNWKSGSSSESSMDSVTSSVNMLLQDCANVANQLELLVIVTLKVLHKLIAFCTELRYSLLVNDTEKLANSLSNSLSMTSPNQKSGKSYSVPPFLLQDIKKFDLFNKLFQLANPIPEKLCNPRIVKLAVSILILLARSSTVEELELFLPAISNGIIKNCFNYEQCFEVQLTGLQLFLILCRSQQISQVCSNTNECLLLTMYNMSYQLLRDSDECKVPMQLYHTVIEILTTLCSQQLSGASCLVESHCPCNIECVKCCVHILYHILEQHQCYCKNAQYAKLDGRDMICSNCTNSGNSSSKQSSVKDCTCECILYQGALLLYTISQKEQNFDIRDVLHKYTILISHLQHLVEMDENQWKIEVSALKELWEFVIDSDSLTEDEETAMETS